MSILSFVLGFVVGGNFGVIIMSLFKSKKN